MSGFQVAEPSNGCVAAKACPATAVSSYSKMAPGGGAPVTGSEETTFNRNPLLCLICCQPYQNPCLMTCYHSFCAGCLKGRAKEGKILCPLCGKVTLLRDGQQLPPSDGLLRFLVDMMREELSSCANCDRNAKSPMFFCNTCVCWSSQKYCDHFLSLINKETGLVLGEVSQLSMYYCNTCGQALCGPCRDETHRAKMFSLHEVIHMSKKPKEWHRKCSAHGEPFTMFDNTKKSLICTKCYRELSPEARMNCMDLETAYAQAFKLFEKAILSIREVQSSLREGVMQSKTLLEELRRNMEAERDAIQTTYNLIHDSIKKQSECLLTDLDSQYMNKDVQLKDHLQNLGMMLPTVQMHLILCTTFTSTANKHEFLFMAYQLIDRLTALAHLSTYPSRPASPSRCELTTNASMSYVHCLEPVIASILTSVSHSQPKWGGAKSQSQYGNTYPPKRSSGDPWCSTYTPAATLSKARSQDAVKKQTLSARGLSDKEFTRHCRSFEAQIKDLNGQFNSIRRQVSELHRDVTARRGTSTYRQVENIVSECAVLTDHLEKTDETMRDRQDVFRGMWDEEQQRIAAEQAVFREQLSELDSLRSDLKQLMNIARQLETHVEAVSDRRAPPLRSRLAQNSAVAPATATNRAAGLGAPLAFADRKNRVMDQSQHLTDAKRSGRNLPTPSGGASRPVASSNCMRAASNSNIASAAELSSILLLSESVRISEAARMALRDFALTAAASGLPQIQDVATRDCVAHSGPSGQSADSSAVRRSVALLDVCMATTSTTITTATTTASTNANRHNLQLLKQSPSPPPPPPPLLASTAGLNSHLLTATNFITSSTTSTTTLSAAKPLCKPMAARGGSEAVSGEGVVESASVGSLGSASSLGSVGLTPTWSIAGETGCRNLGTNRGATAETKGLMVATTTESGAKYSLCRRSVSSAASHGESCSISTAAASDTASTSLSLSSSRRPPSSPGESTSSTVVHRPYEPPALGKSSRVTPVGLDEDPERIRRSEGFSTEGVEVVNVIRFSKPSSKATSHKRSSSSDTNSASALLKPDPADLVDGHANERTSSSAADQGVDAACAAGEEDEAFNAASSADLAEVAEASCSSFDAAMDSCPACHLAAARSSSRGRPFQTSSQAGNFDLDRGGRDSALSALSAISALSALSALSAISQSSCSGRRSSAPEIDENDYNPVSPSPMAPAPADPVSKRSAFSCRSLERPRLPRHGASRKRLPRSFGRGGGGDASDSVGGGSSSDSESTRRYANQSPDLMTSALKKGVAESRFKVVPVLELNHPGVHHQQQIRAEVHRAPEAGAAVKRPTVGFADLLTDAHRYLGPYDTIKPSRTRRKAGATLTRNASGDDLLLHYDRKEEERGVAWTDQAAASGGEVTAQGVLKKADSFEGHEEAVRTLVEAVHESRKFEASLGKNGGRKPSSSSDTGL